ncbi:MAG: hypothetical protein R3F62_19675 [Planctomycetota bacterium]
MIGLNPVRRSRRALARLLVERHAEGDVERALETLAYTAKLAPHDEALALELAELRLRLDPQSPEARAGLRAFCAANPEAWQAARRLSALLVQRGEPAAAEALLAERIEAAPARPRLLRVEAAWYAAGSPAGARRSRLGAWTWPSSRWTLPSPPAGWTRLTRAPQDARLVLARARVELRAGRGPRAARSSSASRSTATPGHARRAVLQQALGALEHDPPSPTLFGPQVSLPNARRLAALIGWRCEAQETLAQALERAGEFAGAAQAFHAAAARAPDALRRASLEARATQAETEAERVRRNRGM